MFYIIVTILTDSFHFITNLQFGYVVTVHSYIFGFITDARPIVTFFIARNMEKLLPVKYVANTLKNSNDIIM